MSEEKKEKGKTGFWLEPGGNPLMAFARWLVVWAAILLAVPFMFWLAISWDAIGDALVGGSVSTARVYLLISVAGALVVYLYVKGKIDKEK